MSTSGHVDVAPLVQRSLASRLDPAKPTSFGNDEVVVAQAQPAFDWGGTPGSPGDPDGEDPDDQNRDDQDRDDSDRRDRDRTDRSGRGRTPSVRRFPRGFSPISIALFLLSYAIPEDWWPEDWLTDEPPLVQFDEDVSVPPEDLDEAIRDAEALPKDREELDRWIQENPGLVWNPELLKNLPPLVHPEEEYVIVGNAVHIRNRFSNDWRPYSAGVSKPADSNATRMVDQKGGGTSDGGGSTPGHADDDEGVVEQMYRGWRNGRYFSAVTTEGIETGTLSGLVRPGEKAELILETATQLKLDALRELREALKGEEDVVKPLELLASDEAGYVFAPDVFDGTPVSAGDEDRHLVGRYHVRNTLRDYRRALGLPFHGFSHRSRRGIFWYVTRDLAGYTYVGPRLQTDPIRVVRIDPNARAEGQRRPIRPDFDDPPDMFRQGDHIYHVISAEDGGPEAALLYFSLIEAARSYRQELADLISPVEIFSLSDGKGGAILRSPYTDERFYITPSELNARLNPRGLSLDELKRAPRQIIGGRDVLAADATGQRLKEELDAALVGLATATSDAPPDVHRPPHVEVEIREPLVFADGLPGRWSFPLRVRWREPDAPGQGEPVVLSYASPVARHEAIEMTRALPKILLAEGLDYEVAQVEPIEGTATLRAMPFERSGLLTLEELDAKRNQWIPWPLASNAAWSPELRVNRIREIIHRKFGNEDPELGHFRSDDGEVYEIVVTPFFDRAGDLKALGPIEFRRVTFTGSHERLGDRSRVEEFEGKVYRSFETDVEPDSAQSAAVLAEAVMNATNEFSERVGNNLIPTLKTSDRGPHELSRDIRDQEEVFSPSDPSGPEGVQSAVDHARTRFDGVAWDLFRPNDEGFFLTEDGVVLHYSFNPEDLRLSSDGQLVEYNPRILAFPEFDEYPQFDARNLSSTIEWTNKLREASTRQAYDALRDLPILPALRGDDAFLSPSLKQLDLRPFTDLAGSPVEELAQRRMKRIVAAVHRVLDADESGHVHAHGRDVRVVVEVLFDEGGAARALLPVRFADPASLSPDDLPPAAE